MRLHRGLAVTRGRREASLRGFAAPIEHWGAPGAFRQRGVLHGKRETSSGDIGLLGGKRSFDRDGPGRGIHDGHAGLMDADRIEPACASLPANPAALNPFPENADPEPSSRFGDSRGR
jgi:hypothetical protein